MKKLIALIAIVVCFAFPALAAQPITSKSSGNVANATATATLPSSIQSWNYLTGFEITAGGAVAAACVNATITGLLGGTTTYAYCVPAGAGIPSYPMTIEFIPPLSGAAINTAIVITLPALGTGNTNAAVVVHGYAE